MKDRDEKAVALQYRRGQDKAPKMTAKGRGLIAQKIIEIAEKNNVPIQKDKVLLDALYCLDINEEIPEELYQAVAEILAFVYRMNKIKGGSS